MASRRPTSCGCRRPSGCGTPRAWPPNCARGGSSAISHSSINGTSCSVLLRRTQASIILRERARLKQALLYSRLRRIALSLGDRLVDGGRLERADDIFFLTADEIDELVAGCAMFPDHQRRWWPCGGRRTRELSANTPPDSMVLAEGEYLGRIDGRARKRRRQGTTIDGALRGLGVCGGTTTASAAVLTDVTEAHLLRPGDVLVTRQTDPGWGAVFPLISGLVMERGGMLSHGAIIAREFGIPSVVGIADATRAHRARRAVHVDGDRGLVRAQRAHHDRGLDRLLARALPAGRSSSRPRSSLLRPPAPARGADPTSWTIDIVLARCSCSASFVSGTTWRTASGIARHTRARAGQGDARRAVRRHVPDPRDPQRRRSPHRCEARRPRPLVVALDIAAAAWYTWRPARRTAATDLYCSRSTRPSSCFWPSARRASLSLVVVLAAAIYGCACAFEIWHDASGPLRTINS